MRKTWTKEEEQLLKDSYLTLEPIELEKLFNVGWSAIKCKAHKLGLNRQKVQVDEQTLIKDYQDGYKIADLSQKYSIEYSTLYRILNKYQIPRKNNNLDNIDINEFTKDYTILTMKELAKKYNVAKPTIRDKAKELGLTRNKTFLYKQPIIKREDHELVKRLYLKDRLSLSDIGKKFGVRAATILKIVTEKGWNISSEERSIRIKNTSIAKYGKFPVNKFGKTQKEIQDWLNSFGFNFNSDHSILNGYEIDLYDSELNLGIEYCGLHWHNENSPNPRDKKYHNDKRLKCEQQGVRLITIFEDEWLHRKEQVKGFLKSVLGKNSRTIFARKCEVKIIDRETGLSFFDHYHIQGSTRLSKHFVGLYFKDELVGVMSFGRHHRNSTQLVLDRLCFKDDVNVTGGASKLFKFLLKETKVKSIISWSDNRWSQGGVYEALGFSLEEELPPDYSYVDKSKPAIRISKQSQKKSNTNCLEGLTEKQWCEQRGLYRIWDCGKKRWLYEIKEL